MTDPPWLIQETRRIVHLLLISHTKAFGRPLMKCQALDDANRLESQELFVLERPVMAHKNSKDPCLIYANAAALQLWCRRWEEMVGMPSRLTAPSIERQKRSAALHLAKEKDAIEGYHGIRVDKKGRKFLINNARIWTLWDERGNAFGQAATFGSWSKI